MDYEIDFRSANGGAVRRLVWATDLHFDAADRSQYKLFFDLILSHEADALLIGGDISNGMTSFSHLANLSKVFTQSIYYVLGNHDFYYGSIEETRKHAQMLSQEIPNLHYLTEKGVIALTDTTALIGHDTWCDGRGGDFLHSDIMLNDYLLIDELKHLEPEKRLSKLNLLGDASADYLKKQLLKALETYDRVIALTHVPLFEESVLYQGVPANNHWLPHFVCKAAGEALEEIMRQNPEKYLLVLCGHAHWGQDIEILPNLRAITGHAELGLPNVQGLVLIN